MRYLSAIWDLIRDAAVRWWQHQCMRLAAAVAFYSMLSLAPLVVLAVALAGTVFGRAAARGELVAQMGALAGKHGAEVIEQLAASAYAEPGAGVVATILGVVLLLAGATGVFWELQDALNLIWGVPASKPGGLWAFVRSRLLSFSMVFSVAFLLVVSLIASALLTALGRYAGGTESALRGLHLLLSFVLLGVLFAVLFRVLPDAEVAWSDVWVGGLFTSALFGVGKYLIGLYLGSSGIGSTYGAAGSFAVFFVWMYYSAIIFFYGAEFTRAYAERFGSRRGHAGQPPPPEQPEAPDRELTRV